MYSNATFVQSYIIIAVVLEIYRIILLSNTCVSGHSFDLVLEIYRITLLSNTYTSGLSACLTFSSISHTVIIEGLLLPFDFRLYNKCWGDTTTVSLPTLFFCKKISI